MREWVRACVRAWVSEWVSEWVRVRVCAWVCECDAMHGWVNEWVNGWLHVWLPEWLNELLLHWATHSLSYCTPSLSHLFAPIFWCSLLKHPIDNQILHLPNFLPICACSRGGHFIPSISWGRLYLLHNIFSLQLAPKLTRSDANIITTATTPMNLTSSPAHPVKAGSEKLWSKSEIL